MTALFRLSSYSSFSQSGKSSQSVKNPIATEPTNVSKPDTRKRRTVTFFENVVVYQHISRDELSEIEYDRSWYNRAELHRIHVENSETVSRMMAGAMQGKQWCPRGLEARTPTGARLRHKHRQESVHAVLQYQTLEKELGGERNVERLAQAYGACTCQSTQVAQLMATIDAQAVEADRTNSASPETSTPIRCMASPYPANSPSPIGVRA